MKKAIIPITGLILLFILISGCPQPDECSLNGMCNPTCLEGGDPDCVCSDLGGSCCEFPKDAINGGCEGGNLVIAKDCLTGCCVGGVCSSEECGEGDIKYYECDSGELVEWCDCREGEWHCIKSPETQCESTNIIEDVNFSERYAENPADDIEDYQQFIENNYEHSEPISSEELQKQFDEAQKFIWEHPEGMFSEDLRETIIDSLNIGFLLDGIDNRLLRVTTTDIREYESYTEKELIFKDPEVGDFSVLLLIPKTGNAPYPAVVGIHGHGDNKEIFKADFYGEDLVEEGYVVIMLSLRAMACGEGSSEEAISEQLLLNGFHLMGLRIYEANLLIRYLKSKDFVDNERIGIMGHSGGSDTSNLVSRVSSDIKAGVYDMDTSMLDFCGHFHCETSAPLAYYVPQINDRSTLEIPYQVFEYGYHWGGDREEVLGFFNNNLKPQRNIKNMSKYSEGQVFMVSDKDWKEVLPLIPVTTWTEQGEVKKYPTLIYHKEENPDAFDIDSSFYFLEQYNPKKITTVGELPERVREIISFGGEVPIENITPERYISYWESFKDIVYSEDDYETALLAATYASLIDAPLFIEGNLPQAFPEIKNVVCVGQISNANCGENYSVKELRNKYVSITGTEKIVLVNPDDITDDVIDENFETQISGDIVDDLYTKASLSAPILASAKHELIISTNEKQYPEVDQYLEDEIRELYQNKPEYLTIIASPPFIEQSMPHPNNSSLLDETDNYIYGHLDSDNIQDLSVGRIYGITSTDVSSYIARVLFYENLPNSNNFNTLSDIMDPWVLNKAKAVDEVLSAYGLNQQSIYFKPVGEFESFEPLRDLEDKKIIAYFDHGNTTGWGGISTFSIRSNDIRMDSPFVYSDACLTSAFERCVFREITHTSMLFSTNMLRRGVIGFIGAVDVASNMDPVFHVQQMLQGKSTGEAWKLENIAGEAKRRLDAPSNPEENTYMRQFTLLGDPTFNFNFSPPENPPPQTEITIKEISENMLRAIIKVPELTQNFSYNSTYSHQRIDDMFGPTTSPNEYRTIGDEIAFISLDKTHHPLYDEFRLFQQFWFSYDIPDGKEIDNISVTYDPENKVQINKIFDKEFNFSDNIYEAENNLDGVKEITYLVNSGNRHYFLFAHSNTICSDNTAIEHIWQECESNAPSGKNTFRSIPAHQYYIGIMLKQK